MEQVLWEKAKRLQEGGEKLDLEKFKVFCRENKVAEPVRKMFLIGLCNTELGKSLGLTGGWTGGKEE